jgi:hypothetical protein
MKFILCLLVLLVGCEPAYDCTGQEKLLLEETTVCQKSSSLNTYQGCLSSLRRTFCKVIK